MLQAHVASYRKLLYETDNMHPVTGYLHHSAKGLCPVDWKDSWEPSSTVRRLSHLDGFVLKIDQDCLTISERVLGAESKDTQLVNIDRQSFRGSDACNTENPFNLDPTLQTFVSIRTGDTINPDLDIASSGAYKIRVYPRSEDASPELAMVYMPDGKAVGTITFSRLAVLYKADMQSSSSTNATTPSSTFPQAVANLLGRYTDGRQTGDYQVQMQNYWTTPDYLMQAVQAGFAVQAERFACPLNFHIGMSNFFSPFLEDNVLGSTHNAYSRHWHGSSQANPEYIAREMQKAVRWALASAAQNDCASLTVFILPYYEKSNTTYQQYLEHPLIHQIAKIPKSALRLQTPTA